MVQIFFNRQNGGLEATCSDLDGTRRGSFYIPREVPAKILGQLGPGQIILIYSTIFGPAGTLQLKNRGNLTRPQLT